MTSLVFGMFLFFFSAFVAVVPVSAWTAPVNNSIIVGDAIGCSFENVMEIMEAKVYSVVKPLGDSLAQIITIAAQAAPRSLPAAVSGGHGSPGANLAAGLVRLDQNLKINLATLAQYYQGRPNYLIKRQPSGLRRFRLQIPLRWNALLEEPANPDAS